MPGLVVFSLPLTSVELRAAIQPMHSQFSMPMLFNVCNFIHFIGWASNDCRKIGKAANSLVVHQISNGTSFKGVDGKAK